MTDAELIAAAQRSRIMADEELPAALCEKLSITHDELNSLFSFCPVNGFTGIQVTAEICRRFGLEPDEAAWSTRLYEQDILTEAEWRWLND
jgi:hypothetical protein